MRTGFAAFGGLLLWSACAPEWTAPEVAVDAGQDASATVLSDGGAVRAPTDAGREIPTDSSAAASADASADAMQAQAVPGRASVPTVGTLGTGGSVRGSAALRLTDDGFELQGRSCSKKLCAEGGIVP